MPIETKDTFEAMFTFIANQEGRCHAFMVNMDEGEELYVPSNLIRRYGLEPEDEGKTIWVKVREPNAFMQEGGNGPDRRIVTLFLNPDLTVMRPQQTIGSGKPEVSAQHAPSASGTINQQMARLQKQVQEQAERIDELLDENQRLRHIADNETGADAPRLRARIAELEDWLHQRDVMPWGRGLQELVRQMMVEGGITDTDVMREAIVRRGHKSTSLSPTLSRLRSEGVIEGGTYADPQVRIARLSEDNHS